MTPSDNLQVFDLAGLGADSISEEQRQLCNEIAACLQNTGCLIVKDQRVSGQDNEVFLNTLEAYFEQDDMAKRPDIREALSYQVGLTPESIETPRLMCDQSLQQEVASLPEAHRATLPKGPDVKCRFMWRCGPRPASTSYPELNAEPVIPQAFPQWREVMDGFGGRLLAVAHTVARCAAVGLGLPPDSLTQAMEGGPHLLAPTGSDLGQHGNLGTVLAGYHSDLNLLTLHGKSRFPGLFVWLADGTRMAVKVPPGCLLVQAGQQLEWLTGGAIKAGKHEVVVTADTQAAVAAARQAGASCWRVSSTLFVHVASDYVLQPLGRFASTVDPQQFPPTPAGLQVQRELETITLRQVDQPQSNAAHSPSHLAGQPQPNQLHDKCLAPTTHKPATSPPEQVEATIRTQYHMSPGKGVCSPTGGVYARIHA